MADKQLAREGEVERLRERIRALEEAGRGICEVFLTRVRFTPDGSKSDEEVLAAGRRAVEAFGGQTVAAALRERDAALARADELRRDRDDLCRIVERATARAEQAEQRVKFLKDDLCPYLHGEDEHEKPSLAFERLAQALGIRGGELTACHRSHVEAAARAAAAEQKIELLNQALQKIERERLEGSSVPKESFRNGDSALRALAEEVLRLAELAENVGPAPGRPDPDCTLCMGRGDLQPCEECGVPAACMALGVDLARALLAGVPANEEAAPCA